MRTSLPPVAAVIAFIDAINRGDVDRLVALMSPSHRLQVLQEPPVTGREANRDAWHGYVTAFPDYVIYPDHLVHRGDDVLVLGSTTGSHLGLPDQEERRRTVIWRATVHDGLLTLWQILEDTPEQRALLGLEEATRNVGQGGPAGPDAALADRLFHNMTGALELFTIYLGERLGLYRALADGGPATSAELAGRTGTAERYVREWLEHHAASGLLEVDDPAASPLARRYLLPPAYAPVLADPDDVRYRAHNGVEIARAGRGLPQLVEAFRTGNAPPPLPWAPEGRAEYNRAAYLNLLGTQWLPAIPDVHERLRREPPARVADLACGSGWSSIALARAYPLVTVDGLDLDPDVIAAARGNAAEAGLTSRVTFVVNDAAGLAAPAGYDLVTIFEALHDMARPVDALRAARGLLSPSGCVLIADELTADEFTAPASELERHNYGWSVVSCLPGAMGDPGTAATGAVMRPATLARYAREAGFRSMEVLPLQTPTWRFYRLSG